MSNMKVQQFILGFVALCSFINCLRAEFIYAAVTGLPMPNYQLPPHLRQMSVQSQADANLDATRPQRSLYSGGGWHAPINSAPYGLGQISKDEFVALLQAAKEVASEEAAAPAPEPEPEPEEGGAPEAAVGGGGGGGAPAGVPLTVSLPAFVPIQLSAMYTAPAPAGGAGGGAVGAGGGGDEGGDEDEGEDEDESEEEEEAAPAPPPHPVYNGWAPFSRTSFGGPRRVVPFIPRNAGKPKAARVKATRSKAKKSKSAKSGKGGARKFSSTRSFKSNLKFAGSNQNYQALPPPPFLSRAPGPLKLVPSNQLLSNWN